MNLPNDSLEEALRLQREAAQQGFDWRELGELWDKLAEEIHELKQAVAEGPERSREELGDLLFMVINLARHLKLDPAAALSQANLKFTRRYGHVLRHLDQLPPLGDPGRLDAMEQWWLEAKRMEKTSGR